MSRTRPTQKTVRLDQQEKEKPKKPQLHSSHRRPTDDLTPHEAHTKTYSPPPRNTTECLLQDTRKTWCISDRTTRYRNAYRLLLTPHPKLSPLELSTLLLPQMQEATQSYATKAGPTTEPTSEPTATIVGRTLALSRKTRKGLNGEATSARSPAPSQEREDETPATPPGINQTDKTPKRQRAESATSHDAEEGEILGTQPQPQAPDARFTIESPTPSPAPEHPIDHLTDNDNDEVTPLTLTPKATPLPAPAGEGAQRAFNRLQNFNGVIIEGVEHDTNGSEKDLDTDMNERFERFEEPSDDEWDMMEGESERNQEKIRGLRKMLNDENDEEDEARQEEEQEALPAARWVPRPLQDFPTTYGESPTFIYSNLQPGQRDAVMMDDEASNLIVLVQGENSWKFPKCNEIAGVIAEEICAFLETEDIDVSPALARTTPQFHNDPPWAFYVRNLSAENALILEEQQVLASRRIQLHVYPAVFMGSSGYGGTIEGLVPSNLKNFTDTKRDILTKDIADILFKHKGFYDAVMIYTMDAQASDADEIPTWQFDQCVRSFLRTEFQVTVLPTKNPNGIFAPSVNLYFLLVTHKDLHRRSILAQLQTVKFGTTRFGTGTYSMGWKCHACRGVDHPTGLCSFKSVPRWEEIVNPPPAPNTAPNQQAGPNTGTRGAARGATRGRGRGQGAGRGQTGGQPPRGSRGGRGGRGGN